MHYRLSEHDVERIRVARQFKDIGNHVTTGEVYPAMVVRVLGVELVNLQVFMDGPDVYWATSREAGPDGATGSLDGRWFWPPRSGS